MYGNQQHHQDDSAVRSGDYGRHTVDAHRAQLQHQSQPSLQHHHSHPQSHQAFVGMHSGEHQSYGTGASLGGGSGGSTSWRPVQQYYNQAPEATYGAQHSQHQQQHHSSYISPYAYNGSPSTFGAYAPSHQSHSSAVFPNSVGTTSNSSEFDHQQPQQTYETQSTGYDYSRGAPLGSMYSRPSAAPSLPMIMAGPPDLTHHQQQHQHQQQQHFQPSQPHMQHPLPGSSSVLHPSQHQVSRTLVPPQPVTPLHAALTQQPTYIGYIKTATDAILLLSACDLPRPSSASRNAPPPQAITRRLLDSERATLICSGSVFAWDEKKAGMRRWTDGKCWSASRVSGCFLTYRELEVRKKTSTNTANGTTVSTSNQYKLDGLIKQSFTITTRSGRKLHVISYFTKRDIREGRLRRVSEDPRFVGEGGGEWGLSVDEEEFRDPSLREGPGTDVPVSARPPRVTNASRASGAVAAAATTKQEVTSNDAVSSASSSRQSGSVGPASSSHHSGILSQRLHLTSNLPPLHHHHLVGGGPGDIPSPPTTGRGGSTANDAPMVASPFAAAQRGSMSGFSHQQQQSSSSAGEQPQHRNGLQGGNAMSLGRSSSGAACAPVHPPFKRTLSDSSDEGAGAMIAPRRPKLARMRSGSWSGVAPSSSASNAEYASASETRMSSFRSSTSAATTVPSSSPGHGSFSKLGEATYVAPPQGQEEHESAVGALLSLRTPNLTSPTRVPPKTCSSAPCSLPNSPTSPFATLSSVDSSTTKGTATLPALPLRSNSDRSALDKFSVRV